MTKWIVRQFTKLWLGKRLRYWNSERIRKKERIEYKDVRIPAFESIQVLSEFMLREFKWTMDTPGMLWDAISIPEREFHTKLPDCDGYSVFAAFVLERDFKLEPFLLTAVTYPPDYSHTICIYKQPFDNEIHVINNGRIKTVPSIGKALTDEAGGGNDIVGWDIIDTKLKTKYYSLTLKEEWADIEKSLWEHI